MNIRILVLIGLFLGVFCGLTTRISAGEKPLLSIGMTAEKIVIDGKLDEKAWKNAGVYGGFLNPDNNPANPGTKIYLLYDKENLYLGYECFEKDIALIKTKTWERDECPGGEDQVDFFINPQPGLQSVGYHFIVNSSGCFYDSSITYNGMKIDAGWNGDWEKAASIGKEAWYAEARIPAKTLGLPEFKPGMVLEGNFCRNRPSAGTAIERLSAIYSGGFQNLEQCFRIKLVESAISVPSLQWQRSESGQGKVSAEILNPGVKTDLHVRVCAVSEKEQRTVAAKKVTAGRESISKVELPFEISGEPVSFVVADNKGCFYVSYPQTYPGVKKLLAVRPEMEYYYLDEEKAKILVELNNPAGLSPVISYSLKDAVSGKSLSSGRKEASGATNFMEVAIGGLPSSKYVVDVEVSVDGKTLAKEQTVFYRVPRPNWLLESVAKVTIGDEGTILINGKPFFCMGMYHLAAEPEALKKDCEDVSYMGFNSVLTASPEAEKTYRQRLDILKEYGMYGMIAMCKVGWGNLVPDREDLTRMICLVRDHPNLVFYSLCDEPGLSYYPTLKKAYKLVKELDPNHPQFITFSGSTRYPDNIWDEFLETCDIVAPDPYPFGNASASIVSAAAKLGSEAVKRAKDKKAVIIVNPCFDYLPTYRRPTPAEARLVAYLAIIHGAKGIMWYSYHEKQAERDGLGYGLSCKALYKNRYAFKGLNSEISYLVPAITGKTPKQSVTVSGEGIDFVLKEDEKSYYLMAANRTADAREGRFVFGKGLRAGDNIDVHYEFRKVAVRDNAFTDTFLPQEVHVYVVPKR